MHQSSKDHDEKIEHLEQSNRELWQEVFDLKEALKAAHASISLPTAELPKKLSRKEQFLLKQD